MLIFFSKAYYQESYTSILIIEYSSMITVGEWLDGSFEGQSRLFWINKDIQKKMEVLKVKVDFEKPGSGSIPESPKIWISRF